MFLETLVARNPRLAEIAFDLHQRGLIQPDCYLLDLDTIEKNAKSMLLLAEKNDLDLYFMTKQLGRNPAVSRVLTNLGFKGAVVVDFREAEVMMENNIPIAHAGHLVQIPNSMLERLLKYGVGLMTVYSIEKAEHINAICKKLGITQNIALKFYRNNDIVYPSQESGFPFSQIKEVIERLSLLTSLNVTDITSFPCYLYQESKDCIEATPNLDTVKLAAKEVGKLLRKPMRLNLPSCTQTTLLDCISTSGGNSAEPGSALVGLTPNNRDGGAVEIPAILYLSEVSHNCNDKGFCYGGGYYRRGEILHAMVGNSIADSTTVGVTKPNSDNIDYHFELAEPCPVGASVIMCFRTQVFVTRSRVVTISGLHSGNPMIEGVYTAQGNRISGEQKL